MTFSKITLSGEALAPDFRADSPPPIEPLMAALSTLAWYYSQDLDPTPPQKPFSTKEPTVVG